MTNKTLLVITDGIGHNSSNKFNAFFSAKSFLNKNQSVTQLLGNNQYKYPALPFVVPNFVKKGIAIPKVNSLVRNPIASSFNVNYPENGQVRYVMVYGSTLKNQIDVNDPSQILNKIAFNEKNPIEVVIPTYKLDKNNSCAITFIDYYGNESEATYVNFTL